MAGPVERGLRRWFIATESGQLAHYCGLLNDTRFAG